MGMYVLVKKLYEMVTYISPKNRKNTLSLLSNFPIKRKTFPGKYRVSHSKTSKTKGL